VDKPAFDSEGVDAPIVGHGERINDVAANSVLRERSTDPVHPRRQERIVQYDALPIDRLIFNATLGYLFGRRHCRSGVCARENR
jgi:hypothetical protein